LFGAAKPHDLDSASEVGQRRIGGHRRLERGERLTGSLEREERLAAADQRAHVVLASLQRPVESWQRRFRVRRASST
jgi:hypothetical protein